MRMTMFTYDDDVNDDDVFCLDVVHNRKSLHLWLWFVDDVMVF